MIEKDEILEDFDDTALAQKHGMSREMVYKRIGRRLEIIGKHMKGKQWKKLQTVLREEREEEQLIIALRGLRAAAKLDIGVKPKLIKL